MSISVTRRIWWGLPEVGFSCRLVALALGDHADPDGSKIFPSLARIARMTGLDRRRVRREVAALKRMGWLERVGERCGGTLVYRVSPIWMATTAKFDRETEADDRAGTPTHLDKMRFPGLNGVTRPAKPAARRSDGAVQVGGSGG